MNSLLGDLLTDPLACCRTVAAIQKDVVKWGKRNPVSRRLCLKCDEEAIANWVLSLDEIRRALAVRLSTVVLAISNRLP